MTQFARRFLRGVSTIAVVLSAGSSLHAQTATAPAAVPAAPATEAPAADEAKEIVVTGSHLGKSSFNSPTPVNVVGAQRMQDLGIPNVADALNQIPSFRAATTPSTSLFRVSGAIGGNSVDLRGLSATRTLTLVDGRRFVPSTDNGTVDINGIPSALVQRTEIVTGGASAAYGADAVAGVVNLILDTKFSGLKTDFNGGIAGHGDNKNVFASIAYGQDFAGGRGHFIAGVEFQKNWGMGVCETRAYCRGYTNYVANPGYIGGVSTNGQPATLVLRDVRFVENQSGVLISVRNAAGTTLGQQVNNTGATALPAGLRGLQFNAAGTALVPFQFGNYLSGQFMQGGDASVDRLYGFDPVPLVTPTWHVSSMAHADYDLTDTIKVSGEFLYSHTFGGPISSAYFQGVPAGGSAGISINNPYITPAVRAQILAVDPTITTLNVNVAKPEVGNQLVGTSSNDVYRGVLAARGKLFGDWKWDASYTHGETHSYVKVTNSRLKAVDGEAIAAVTPPAGYTGPVYTTPSGASVICSSSIAAPTNGCIPVNLLGVNSITPAMYNKYWQTEWQTRTIKQDVISANVRGGLFRLPAGMVQAATGIEYRHDTAVGDTDPLTLANAFTSPQTTALPLVDRKVVEGYIEASVPVLADLPFAKSLTIDGAVRRTHYNAFGGTTTWKVGGEYQPDDQLMIRVTRSQDIRAPTAAESNPNSIVTLLPQVDPFTGTTHQISNISGGNANLQLEKAETFTLGAVLRPRFLPRFRLSVDYYKIDVKQAIDSLSGPVIMDACFRQNQYCNLIGWSGAPKASAVASLFTNFQNLAQVQARGLEIVSEYRIPDVLHGNLDFQLNANYVFRLVSIGGTGVVTRLDGVTGNAGSLTNVLGVPTYKIDGIVTYSRPSWSVTGHARYIPNSILDPTKCGPDEVCYNVNSANSISNNRIAARFYFDLSATIRPGIQFAGSKNVEFYGSITNLFDTYPPSALRFFGNPLQYDPVGRAFRIGVRTRF